jgi:hypothetical protein
MSELIIPTIARACINTIIFVFFVIFILALNSDNTVYQVGLSTAILTGFVASLIALCSLILWGIPIHYLFKYIKFKSCIWYMLSGLVPGFLLVFYFHIGGNDPLEVKINQFMQLGGLGTVAACVFWFSTNRPTDQRAWLVKKNRIHFIKFILE